MVRKRIVKSNPDEYKGINKEIRNKIREAKEKEMQGKCDEIEALQLKYDSFNFHQNVKRGNRKIQN